MFSYKYVMKTNPLNLSTVRFPIAITIPLYMFIIGYENY
jgi:hypothetical protein